MPSTIPLFAAPAPAGLEEEEINPLISFLTVPTPSSATDLHLPPRVHGTVTKEMQKQKKRETDRLYRKNKKEAVQETENKLAMTIIENENLKSTVKKFRQEISHLTSQIQLIYQRFKTIYTELEKEIECVRTENELTECLLNDPNTINI
ncbi:hypothetical protein NC652_000172 [Populus alba x Populus x berolinensis]|nr:hypothetical protein NC652_000172 [Populus alba x Populus x berolinensis]